MILLRAVARLLAVLLLVALALLGLAVAIFSIQGGDGFLSLPHLARFFDVPALQPMTGRWLGQLCASGPVALVSLGGGLAAVAAGLAILVGLLVPRRERLLLVDDGEDGRILARRRPVARMAAALAAERHGVTKATARLRPRRRGQGGTLKVRARYPRSVGDEPVGRRVEEALEPLAAGFSLRTKVRAKRTKERVQ